MHATKSQIQSLITLKKRADFVKMNAKAPKWVSKGVIVQVLPNDLAQKRVGYTVTKRTDKSAVKRNRIKRRLRAVAADVLPLYAQDSCDYVLIGRPLTATRPYEELLSDLKWCLRKLGHTKESHEKPADTAVSTAD